MMRAPELGLGLVFEYFGLFFVVLGRYRLSFPLTAVGLDCLSASSCA